MPLHIHAEHFKILVLNRMHIYMLALGSAAIELNCVTPLVGGSRIHEALATGGTWLKIFAWVICFLHGVTCWSRWGVFAGMKGPPTVQHWPPVTAMKLTKVLFFCFSLHEKGSGTYQRYSPQTDSYYLNHCCCNCQAGMWIVNTV